jgi:hypothetical protein
MVTEALKSDEISGQSLLNEGLRIAEQYGMADFATEIKELGRNTSQCVSIKQEISDEFCKTQESSAFVTKQIDAVASRLSSDIAAKIVAEPINVNTEHSSQS